MERVGCSHSSHENWNASLLKEPFQQNGKHNSHHGETKLETGYSVRDSSHLSRNYKNLTLVGSAQTFSKNKKGPNVVKFKSPHLLLLVVKEQSLAKVNKGNMLQNE